MRIDKMITKDKMPWSFIKFSQLILYGNFLCLSPPSASLALQYGRFVPREWLAAKGLFQGDPSGFKKGLE